jgi:glycosyltransferase involved in cell wall biosynthesis
VQQPLVSVILPVYNGEKHLKEAIDSILNQTYTHLELIIIDDASTDCSPAIINGYADERIKYYRNDTNLRIVQSLNKAITYCRGEYIARMDADDVAKPERIAKQLAYLHANTHVALADTIMEYIDENSQPLGRYNNSITNENAIRKNLLMHNCLGHSSIMTRKEVYAHYKYRQIDYEDYDMWLRMLNDGLVIQKIAEPLLQYRIHTASITGAAQINNTHFYKQAKTMYYYCNHLPILQRLKPMNLTVWYYATKAYLLWMWKKLKN